MKRATEIKAFRGARMNLDVSPELAQPNEVREVYNMVEEVSSGKITNMKGFENILDMAVNSGFAFSEGTNKCVGTCRDIEGSSIIYFILNDRSNHGIVSMDTVTKALTWVLKDEPLLNFKKRVKANVIQGLLYWTDGYFNSFLNSDFNPPRKINIAKAMAYTAATKWAFQSAAEAGAYTGNPDYSGYTLFLSPYQFIWSVGDKVVSYVLDGINRSKEVTGYGEVIDFGYAYGNAYVITNRPWQLSEATLSLSGNIMVYQPNMYFGIDWQVIDRIKYQPVFAPTASYGSDETRRSNNLRKRLFQFSYRYVYDDNEKTVWSPVSDVPLPTVTESYNGGYEVDPTVDNMINVWFDTGPLEVKAIEVASRNNNDGLWTIVNRKYKYDENGNLLLGNDIFNVVEFYNTEIGEATDQTDIFRLYDAVPQVSSGQELIEKNRILDADFWQDYNNIDIDAWFNVLSDYVNPGDVQYYNGTIEKKVTTPVVGFYDVSYQAYRMNLNGFYEEGYTYFITVDVFPYQYIGTTTNNNPLWFEFLGKTIRAISIVTATSGMTISTFLNKVCGQLRAGSVGTAVIGINSNNEYNVLGDYSGFIAFPENTPYCSPTTFGVIVGGGLYDNPPYPPTNITILKVKNSAVFKTWKSGETKMLGFEYVDRAGRTSMVMRSSNTSVYVPAVTEYGGGHNIRQNYLKAYINHQPPDWAKYFRIVYAKGKSSSFYLQASISMIEDADSLDCLKFDVNQYIMYQNDADSTFNIGKYEWQQGDRVRFLMNRKSTGEWISIGANLDFDILGVYTPTTEDIYQIDNTGDHITDSNGNKIIETRKQNLLVQTFDYAYHGIAANKTVVEIYRPSKLGENDIYYQKSQTYRVLNPHTENRVHDGDVQQVVNAVPAAITITSGDAYIYTRLMYNAFPVESCFYSDRYKSDAIDIGKVNASDRNAQRVRYLSKLIFSGKLIQNTRVNDLSRVDASDSFELSDKYGAIHHIEEVGDTVKVLQKSKVSHLLVGRAGVTQPNEEGTQIMSSTKDVLGTLILQRSDFGTQHPGSVTRFENRLYWFDFDAASICRDPGNGIQNLTENFGLKAFMAEKVKAFGSASNCDVVSAYDQANEIVWWTFIDLTNSVNSFTMGFRDTGGRNQDGFVLFTSAIPDFYGQAKYTLTSFKDNAIWLHNSDNVPRCNFYGTQYGYYVTVIANSSPANDKRFKQISVSTNAPVSAPTAGDITIEPCGNHPDGMLSLLKEAAFTSVQGKYVADFGRNMITNSPTPTLDDLINGDDLEGQAMTVKLQGSQTTEHKIFTVEIEEIINE